MTKENPLVDMKEGNFRLSFICDSSCRASIDDLKFGDPSHGAELVAEYQCWGIAELKVWASYLGLVWLKDWLALQSKAADTLEAQIYFHHEKL